MIKIGGLLPFTTIDYPGKLSAVLFCQGCVLNCPYCHNPELRILNKASTHNFDDVLDFLKKRRGLLDCVVFSGGEPLVQKDLKSAIFAVKSLGYSIGLHTSGVLTDRLLHVLDLIDWIGLDVKGDFDSYAKSCGVGGDMGTQVRRAIQMIVDKGISFEVRTTTDPKAVSKAEILSLVPKLKNMGVTSYALQEYRPIEGDLVDLNEVTSFYTDSLFLNEVRLSFPDLIIRR